MKLTELQKLLLSALKSAGLDKDTVATILSALETEQREEAMANWLEAFIKDCGHYPNQTQILRALEIIDEKIPLAA